MITVFGSWFSNYYNRLYWATEGGTKWTMGAATEVVMLPFVVAVLSALLVMDEPDDDEEWAMWSAKQYGKFMIGTLPLIRDMGATFEGFSPTTPYMGLLEVPAKAIGVGKHVYKGDESVREIAIDIGKVVSSTLPIAGSGSIIRVLEFMESDSQGKERGSAIQKTYQALVEGKDR
jgi:hypothetical protein